MLSIFSNINGIGTRACVTGGGGRKESVSKIGSPMFCKRSTMSMPSSSLCEAGTSVMCEHFSFLQLTMLMLIT